MQVEEEEGVNQGAGMRGMVDEANTLRTAFPGVAWETGERVGRYNSRHNEFPLMSKKEWGGGKAPYGLAEPVLWYWTKLGKVYPTRQGQNGYDMDGAGH